MKRNLYYIGGQTKPATPNFQSQNTGDIAMNGMIGQGIDMLAPGAGTAYNAVAGITAGIGNSMQSINTGTGAYDNINKAIYGKGLSETFNPIAGIRTASQAWQDDDATAWDKIGSTLGIIPGLSMFGNSYDKKAIKQQQNENISAVNTEHQKFLQNQLAGMGMNNTNMAAFGGNLAGQTQSNLREFNNGGSHESNQLGGIPVSYDDQGVPNLVEENETMKDSFVFSDRLKLSTPEEFDLAKGYKNKSFANISKDLNKSFDERPNDSIAKATFEDMSDRLKKANQSAKDAKMMSGINNKFGGSLYADGGELNIGEYDLGDTDLDMQEIEYLKSQGYNVEPIQVN